MAAALFCGGSLSGEKKQCVEFAHAQSYLLEETRCRFEKEKKFRSGCPLFFLRRVADGKETSEGNKNIV